jgi:glucokinase
MKKFLCGVDVGGTKLSAGLFEEDGTYIDSRIVFNHTTLGCDGITDSIVVIVRELLDAHGLDESQLWGIGVGIAGHINSKKGLIITSSNFKSCFRNYPLRSKLARKFRTNIIVDNDANAQAYGEFKFGAGKTFSNIVFITVSSGVGSGIIVDGNLVRGMAGTAGEIGHTIIDPYSEIECSCGNKGCLMSISSGHYLPQLYLRYLKRGYVSQIGISEDNLDAFDGRMLEEGVKRDDEISKHVLNDSASAVGVGLYNLFQILNPEIFILGGGLVNIGEIYIELIEKRFLSLVRHMMYDRVEIRSSALGCNAGLLGAAALTLE